MSGALSEVANRQAAKQSSRLAAASLFQHIESGRRGELIMFLKRADLYIVAIAEIAAAVVLSLGGVALKGWEIATGKPISLLMATLCFFAAAMSVVMFFATLGKWLRGCLPYQIEARRDAGIKRIERLAPIAKELAAIHGTASSQTVFETLVDVIENDKFNLSDEEANGVMKKLGLVLEPEEVAQTANLKLTEIFNKDNPRYRPDLAAAVAVWLSYEIKGKDTAGTVKDDVIARLNDWSQGEELGESERKRIAVMVNWDKTGSKFGSA